MTLYHWTVNGPKPVYTGTYSECLIALGKVLNGKVLNAPENDKYFIGEDK